MAKEELEGGDEYHMICTDRKIAVFFTPLLIMIKEIKGVISVYISLSE